MCYYTNLNPIMHLTQSCHCGSEQVVRYMDVFLIKCVDCSEEPEKTYKFCPRCGAAVDKEEVLIRYYGGGS